tara:strand:+ start:614 stop:835 length:222 start_codon:yes stop_codon:yes gene_type:complete
MSAQPKDTKKELGEDFYMSSINSFDTNNKNSKVNLNDLVNRLNLEKKKERKNNLILSAAAVSAVTVFGIILTL